MLQMRFCLLGRDPNPPEVPHKVRAEVQNFLKRYQRRFWEIKGTTDMNSLIKNLGVFVV